MGNLDGLLESLTESMEFSKESAEKAERRAEEMEEHFKALVVEAVTTVRLSDDNAPLAHAISFIPASIANSVLEKLALSAALIGFAQKAHGEAVELDVETEMAREIMVAEGFAISGMAANLITDLTNNDPIKRMEAESYVENLLYNAKK